MASAIYGVSNHRHAPAALYPRGKDPRYPLDKRLGGPQSWSGHGLDGKSSLPLPGIKPRSPCRPVHRQIYLCVCMCVCGAVTVPKY
jgi:hypothetical protein